MKVRFFDENNKLICSYNPFISKDEINRNILVVLGDPLRKIIYDNPEITLGNKPYPKLQLKQDETGYQIYTNKELNEIHCNYDFINIDSEGYLYSIEYKVYFKENLNKPYFEKTGYKDLKDNTLKDSKLEKMCIDEMYTKFQDLLNKSSEYHKRVWV